MVEHHDGSMEVIDAVAAVDDMLAAEHGPSLVETAHPDPLDLAELIRADRGLELEQQWRVTLGETIGRGVRIGYDGEGEDVHEGGSGYDAARVFPDPGP